MDNTKYWERYKKYLYYSYDLGLKIDISRMNFSDNYFEESKTKMISVFESMKDLEKGAIANPDEERMVGHYWLRNPSLAPTKEIEDAITNVTDDIKEFSKKIHAGEIKGQAGVKFSKILLIGIGGSALGPQFVANALGTSDDKMEIYFLDNTDPDGIDTILEKIQKYLKETLVIVISKSGGTKETSNGMQETKEFFVQNNVNFDSHAIAITQENSKLENIAKRDKWLKIYPLWDFVGGRTSVTSPVGLLPAALQGIDIDGFLKGARTCDIETRKETILENPAAILALIWLYATKGVGDKQMVIIPYNDRLQLFSKYLQQLIMESLGKERDLQGKVVNQGIAVFGNKGSTDQHSYVQQLLEGPNNIFVTLIEVLKKRKKSSIILEDQVTSGDYLNAFLHGTRNALTQKGKESVTITIDEVNAYHLGILIALYERAVGIYASLININAYHQPGVERGKKIASFTISLEKEILDLLRQNKDKSFTVEEIAKEIKYQDEVEIIFKILQHLSLCKDYEIVIQKKDNIFSSRYCIMS